MFWAVYLEEPGHDQSPSTKQLLKASFYALGNSTVQLLKASFHFLENSIVQPLKASLHSSGTSAPVAFLKSLSLLVCLRS